MSSYGKNVGSAHLARLWKSSSEDNDDSSLCLPVVAINMFPQRIFRRACLSGPDHVSFFTELLVNSCLKGWTVTVGGLLDVAVSTSDSSLIPGIRECVVKLLNVKT